MQFTVQRARSYEGLIRYHAGAQGNPPGCLVLETNPTLVRPITGAPDWLDPFLPSVHIDVVGNKWRVRSCIAPCPVPRGHGFEFKRFRTQGRVRGWLNENPDWPYAMLSAIHANYLMETGRCFRLPLGDRARAAWTDEHTGILVGWKLLKGV